MIVLVVALTVAVLLLGVLVAGLLRSHAEILRQLHTLGAGREETVTRGLPTRGLPTRGLPARGQDAPARPGFEVRTGVIAPTAGALGQPAYDLAGTTPGQESAVVSVLGAGHDTLLAFLSSGCLTCHTFWDVFRAGDDLGLPANTRLVVVTKGTDMESLSAVRELAPPQLVTLMSTETWLAYGVPGSPYFVHVDGAVGRVAGEGSATSWSQVMRLAGEATADRALATAPPAGGPAGPPAGLAMDRGDGAYREARADRELLAAGITPGHESLHLGAHGFGSPEEVPIPDRARDA